ncbi:MAG: hypothetical protein QM687_01890 [Ferruginibacter sp.]
MKKSTKIMIGVAALAAAGVAAYMINQQRKRKRSAHVADEGYETAHDVLYPHKSISPKLKFGPVLPE